MRTTLDIEEDILLAAKELARREGKTAGKVLSELARRALTQGGPAAAGPPAGKTRPVLGFVPFESRGGLVTDEIVNRLRDEDDD